ncbi:AlpA family phage regulatory protein [Stenotrophomonas maltophilia]|nr:AlpA family phage regulatory protein [Stenotrophomonas maltophilia]
MGRCPGKGRHRLHRPLHHRAGLRAAAGLSHSRRRAQALGVERTRAGTFPKPVKLSERTTRWVSTEVDRWVAEVIAKRA